MQEKKANNALLQIEQTFYQLSKSNSFDTETKLKAYEELILKGLL